MFKNYLRFLIKVFVLVVLFLFISYCILGMFFDAINVLDKIQTIFFIAFSVTVFTGVTAIKEFLVVFDRYGVTSGFLRKKTAWKNINSLRIVSFFGVKFTKIIILSTVDNEITCKASWVQSKVDVYTVLKTNLSWIPSDFDFNNINWLEIKK